MLASARGRLVAAALGLFAGTAAAQDAGFAVGPVAGCPFGNCAAANHGTYGPALFAPNKRSLGRELGPNEPACVGHSSYPLSDWKYIKRFCGPTLNPGSCYGHYQTKWRRWEDHCADGHCAAGGVGIPSDGVTLPPPPLVSAGPPPAAPPMQPPAGDAPKVDPTPGPLPLVPVAPPTAPLPLPLPKEVEPGKISTTEATRPAVVPVPVPSPVPDVVRPQPDLDRTVVPPLPK